MTGQWTLNRRAWLLAASSGVLGRRQLFAQPRTGDVERRIRSVIEEYGDQGFHRTGTDVDRRSGDWLFDSVARLGVTPGREPFILSRVDPGDCHLVVGGRRIDGLPLFDGGFTGLDGVSGRLGPVGSDAEIGLVTAPPNTAAAGALGDARRQNRHKAIVCVTRGSRPGLCLNNADAFLKPFGPPVLQVSSDERSFLEQHAANSTAVQVFSTATRTRAESFNVTATVAGSARGLAPLIIMTPRSGWYSCASERGGGIACWLEVMRAFRQTGPRRDVFFVASSGHELGHLGIDVFIENRPGLVKQATGWMHLGANIGAATRPPGVAASESSDPQRRNAAAAMASGNTIQASDDDSEALLSKALASAGLTVGRRVPRGTVPGGEAENVHRGGGRYVSVIGSNGLFHHPDDRGIHTVDLSAIASFASALTSVARAWTATALILLATTAASAQPATGKEPPSTLRAPSRAELLRGEYGRYRANNDLLHYDLDVRIDPEKKLISGRNAVRFKMLKDDTRIQLELYANLNIDRIVFNTRELKFTRERNTVYIDFPETLRSGRTYAIDVHYSGAPLEVGRFDALAFKKDPAGGHWINTANEGVGSSVWWPSKDQWRDEPESMEIKVSVPNGLTNVSNGRFIAKTDLGDGYTKWHYRVHYPINSYNVSLNIANYVHFGETMGDLTLDYYVLPANLDKAKKQFAQVKPMMEAFLKYFGEYPFKKDGFKLIEVPYSGMEHQSAVTYGNRYANGYLERDWTGVGVSLKFDFIIIHESAHEWFGNAVSAAEQSDMWIHEGWATYLECLYVEHLFGAADALKYTNGYKTKIINKEPIIVQRGIARDPNQDQYFKGALFLHTLRSVVNDDQKWFKLIRDVYDEFKYRNVMTEEMVAFINKQLGQDLTPIFDQYLRRPELPVLQLTFDEKEQLAWYRWNAGERAFAMPIRVGDPANWQTVQPVTSAWKSMPWQGTKDQFKVATDLYYVSVAVLDAGGRPVKP